MNKFDKQEQEIHAAFSQIDVDAEGFKSKLNFSTTVTKKKSMKFASIAAAVFVFMVVTVTAYAAATGRFDFIRSIIESPFIDYAVEQSEATYAEDQGIRIEAIAAEKIGDVILLYLAIQDVSDQGLFAPYSWDSLSHTPPTVFLPLNHWSDHPEIDVGQHWYPVVLREPLDYYYFTSSSLSVFAKPFLYSRYIGGSGSISQGLHFNQETQTFYLEMLIVPSLHGNLQWDDVLNYDETLSLIVYWLDVSYFYERNTNTNPLIPHDQMYYQKFITGEWQFEITVSGIEHPTIVWESLTVGNLYFDYFQLSPLSFRGAGSGISPTMIEIEMDSGDNIFAYPGGSIDRGNRVFYIDWISSEGSIDIESVTAIIINGYRIEVPE